MAGTRGFLLAVCVCLAAVTGTTAAGAADVRMTEDEITSKLLYNTATLEDLSEQQLVVYFPAPGEVRGSDSDTVFHGSWKLANDKLCLDVPVPAFAHCWAIFLRGDSFFLQDDGGMPAGRISFASGNPQDF